MFAYAVRRVIYMIPIVFGVILFTFILFYVVNSPDALALKELQKAANPDTIRQWKLDKGFLTYTQEGLVKKRLIESGELDGINNIGDGDVRPVSKWSLFLQYLFDLITFNFGRDRDDRLISQVLLQGAVPSL
ncbi:MAG: hypothetical protein ABIH23_01785, partial [bacterium]